MPFCALQQTDATSSSSGKRLPGRFNKTSSTFSSRGEAHSSASCVGNMTLTVHLSAAGNFSGDLSIQVALPISGGHSVADLGRVCSPVDKFAAKRMRAVNCG